MENHIKKGTRLLGSGRWCAWGLVAEGVPILPVPVTACHLVTAC